MPHLVRSFLKQQSERRQMPELGSIDGEPLLLEKPSNDETEMSQGSVSWQIGETFFEIGPLASSIG
jgi:hypothetical protein